MKNIQVLTSEELLMVNGGDGFWYDIAYAVGAGAHAVVNALNQHMPSSGNTTYLN